MKLNVSVELGYLDEEGTTIEDVVRERIVKEVVDRIRDKAIKDVEKKAVRQMAIVEKSLNDAINKRMEEWLAGEVVITDKWGDVKFEGTLDDMLKKRFDNFWSQQVDNNGDSFSGYGSVTRMQWLIDQRVANLSKKFTKDLASKVSRHVKETLTDQLKATIGGELVENLGVPRIVEQLKVPRG